jgi:hypothetical protein
VTAEPEQPLIRIVRGEATPEEVAAIVAALASVTASSATRSRKITTFRSLWAKPSRNIRPPLGPSPGAWRASGFPR